MTLRLVDKDNVCALPTLGGVAASARGFADKLDSGEITARTAMLVVINDEGRLDFTCFGQGVTIAEGLGFLELAKAKVIEGAWR